MKVPEWVDLVKTNNRLVFKLFMFIFFSFNKNSDFYLGRSLCSFCSIFFNFNKNNVFFFF